MKASGELQNLSFGILVAADEWPGRVFDPSSGAAASNPFEGRQALVSIGRVKWGLGGDGYAGVFAADRRFAGGDNFVLGLDFYERLGSGNHFFRGHYLFSMTKNQAVLENRPGSSATVSYEYHSKPFDATSSFEYYGRDFHLDTAFIRRTGIAKFTTDLTLNTYPQGKLNSWLKRISTYLQANWLRDLETRADDSVLKGGLKFNFARNGNFRVEGEAFREAWAGRIFKGFLIRSQGALQPANWLGVSLKFRAGDGISYDPARPVLGGQVAFDIQTTIQANDQLTQFFQYSHEVLNRQPGAERLYSVDILNSNTTFQVNRNLFFRAIVRYDSYVKAILADALISFELIPGTVVFLGYGSLHEKRPWDESEREWSSFGLREKFYQVRQSLFFKASLRVRL